MCVCPLLLPGAPVAWAQLEISEQGQPAAGRDPEGEQLIQAAQKFLMEKEQAWNDRRFEDFFEDFEHPSFNSLKSYQGESTREMVERLNRKFEFAPTRIGLLSFRNTRLVDVTPGTQLIATQWTLDWGELQYQGNMVFGYRLLSPDKFDFSTYPEAIPQRVLGPPQQPYFGWSSLIPPLLAIFLAIITRRVLLSLFVGIAVGCGMLAGLDGVTSFSEMFSWLVRLFTILCQQHLWQVLIDPEKLQIQLFVILMGAMVGVIHRCGGMHGVVDKLTPLAKTRIGGQVVTWVLGLIIFFDDYANTLLLGNTMRPVTDRLKISREKLAYIVDSTAAPVAGLAIISTWIAMLISQVDLGFDAINQETAEPLEHNAFFLVLQSIPYRFYIILAICFVPMVAFLGRDFGPMLRAEQRTQDGYLPDDIADLSGSEAALPTRNWLNAVVPIVVLIAGTVFFLFMTGRNAVLESDGQLKMELFDIWSNGDSYLSLMYASLLGLLAALLLPTLQKIMSGRELFDAAWTGIKTVVPAMAILWLAWTLSGLTTDEYLGTQKYLGDLLTVTEKPDWCPESLFIVYLNITSAMWLPTTVFLLSAFVAFATGSSWGTLAILSPIVIKATYDLTTMQLGDCPPEHPLMLASIASVISGSIFGDHCSPISDTTVLSSQASSCDHIAHVRTQMPYALLVGFVAILFGTLPVGLFSYYQESWVVPMWAILMVTMLLGLIVLLSILLIFGRRPRTT